MSWTVLQCTLTQRNPQDSFNGWYREHCHGRAWQAKGGPLDDLCRETSLKGRSQMFLTGPGSHSSGLECKFYWFQLKSKFCESSPKAPCCRYYFLI